MHKILKRNNLVFLFWISAVTSPGFPWFPRNWHPCQGIVKGRRKSRNYQGNEAFTKEIKESRKIRCLETVMNIESQWKTSEWAKKRSAGILEASCSVKRSAGILEASCSVKIWNEQKRSAGILKGSCSMISCQGNQGKLSQILPTAKESHHALVTALFWILYLFTYLLSYLISSKKLIDHKIAKCSKNVVIMNDQC